MIDLKVTKYRGAKKADGGYEQDILVVEEITGLQEKPIPGTRAIYKPFGVTAPRSGNIIVPGMFLDNGYQIVASPKFMAVHIDGVPGAFGRNVGHKLAVINSNNVEFFVPKDLGKWKVGSKKILKSKDYVNLQKLLRDSTTMDGWVNGGKIDRQIQVKATRLSRTKSGLDRILIDKLEIIPGPLIDPHAKRLKRPLITTEPVIYGNVKAWKIPLVEADGVEVYATDDFIKRQYYCILDPMDYTMLMNIIPEKGFKLWSDGLDKLAEGESTTIGTTTYAFNGQYKRKNLNSNWKFSETNFFQAFYGATKYLNPETGSPVIVLNHFNSLKNIPRIY